MIIHWGLGDPRAQQAVYLGSLTNELRGLPQVGGAPPADPAETFPDLSNLQGRVNVAAGATGQVLPRDETGALLYSNQRQKFQTSLEIQTGDPCACTVLYHLMKRTDDR